MLQCLHIAVSSSFLWMKGAFFHHSNETNKKIPICLIPVTVQQISTKNFRIPGHSPPPL
jgi:hypothetical protein